MHPLRTICAESLDRFGERLPDRVEQVSCGGVAPLTLWFKASQLSSSLQTRWTTS